MAYAFPVFKVLWQALLDLLSLVVMLFSVFCGKCCSLKPCGKGYLICLVLWLCCSLCFVANTIPLFKVLW